jgi:hydrogenase maturation protease
LGPARRELTVGAATPVGDPLAWPRPREGPATIDGRPVRAARVLIGGVGYTNLRDRSFGPLLIERLRRRAWPDDVVVEDLSYGPIDVLFKLQAESRPFRLGLFVGAVARGRPPGTVVRYVWPRLTPAADELQERIGEAVTGVVSLENLLQILTHFGALPQQTVVVEVEPEPEEGWGPELSAPVTAALIDVEALILDELTEHPGRVEPPSGGEPR